MKETEVGDGFTHREFGLNYLAGSGFWLGGGHCSMGRVHDHLYKAVELTGLNT